MIGVRCRTRKQVQKVIDHITREGCDLPDKGRVIYPDGKPEQPHQRNIGNQGVVRWYSGGPGDWNYLFTIGGDRLQAMKADEWIRDPTFVSLGDNRFWAIYEAKDVLSPTIFDQYGRIHA